MINWQSIIFNSFWISGLAVLLAATSYNVWAAAENGRSLREQLGRVEFQRFFWLAISLICIGLVGTSQEIWEMAIWAGLALIALVLLAGSSRETAT